MQQSYHHIGTVLFEHKYFKNNMIPSLSISLADGTPKLLNDLDIIVKPFPGGLHLLASKPDLFDTFDNESPLRLYLHNTDNLFFNYTDLPFYNLQNNLLYFNNLNPVEINDTNSFSLQTNDFVSEHDLVELTGSYIDISLFEPVKSFKITDVFGYEFYSQEILQSTQDNQYFNTNILPEGIVKVSIDEEEKKQFYHTNQTVWKKPIAVFEIYLGTLFSQYINAGKVDYRIGFNNIQTIWKYFLVSPVYKKFKNLSIINKEKEQIFSAPQKQFIQSNTEALVFESQKKIPISEQKKPTFQLIDDFDLELQTGKVILKNLPGASTEQLFYDGTESDGTIYSHIYI